MCCPETWSRWASRASARSATRSSRPASAALDYRRPESLVNRRMSPSTITPTPAASSTPQSGTSNTRTSTMQRPENVTMAPASMSPAPGLATAEDEAAIGLGILHARALAVVARPGAQHLLDPLALAHLRDVGAERRALEGEGAADVDPGVGLKRSAHEHLLHLVGLEALVEELAEDGPRLRRREHRVERRAGDRAMIRMVEVFAAVPAHRRVAAHDDVGPRAPDDAGQIGPQCQRRLERAVLVAEQDQVFHAENLGGVPRLALADGHQTRVVRRVLVGARPAAGHQAEGDLASLPGPRGGTAGDRELVVVRVRRDAEDARERRVERDRLAPGARHWTGPLSTRACGAARAPAAGAAP